MPRVLIIGGDSTLGRGLAQAFTERGATVWRTTRRPAGAGGQALALDLSTDVSTAELPSVDIAYICAAMTRFGDCLAAPDLAHQVNVRAPVALADRLLRQGVRVILLSTSAVLDCAEPKASASRVHAPKGVYGYTKALAEAAFLELEGRSAIVRLTKVLTPDNGVVRKWTTSLGALRPVDAFCDHYIAPITLSYANEALIAAGTNDGTGIYQISGAEDVSYFEVAQLLATALGAPRSLVRASRAAEAGLHPDTITRYTSLDTARIEALTGTSAPSAGSVIRALIDKPTVALTTE